MGAHLFKNKTNIIKINPQYHPDWIITSIKDISIWFPKNLSNGNTYIKEYSIDKFHLITDITDLIVNITNNHVNKELSKIICEYAYTYFDNLIMQWNVYTTGDVQRNGFIRYHSIIEIHTKNLIGSIHIKCIKRITKFGFVSNMNFESVRKAFKFKDYNMFSLIYGLPNHNYNYELYEELAKLYLKRKHTYDIVYEKTNQNDKIILIPHPKLAKNQSIYVNGYKCNSFNMDHDNIAIIMSILNDTFNFGYSQGEQEKYLNNLERFIKSSENYDYIFIELGKQAHIMCRFTKRTLDELVYMYEILSDKFMQKFESVLKGILTIP